MPPSWFADILAKHARVAVTGGPKTGKTTLCDGVRDAVPVYSTDEWLHLDWSEASQAVADSINKQTHPRLVVEGVAVPRALRKGMKADAVVYLDTPHVELSKGQRVMAAGLWTVLSEWRAAHPDVPVYFPGRTTAA